MAQSVLDSFSGFFKSTVPLMDEAPKPSELRQRLQETISKSPDAASAEDLMHLIHRATEPIALKSTLYKIQSDLMPESGVNPDGKDGIKAKTFDALRAGIRQEDGSIVDKRNNIKLTVKDNSMIVSDLDGGKKLASLQLSPPMEGKADDALTDALKLRFGPEAIAA